jgi:hypothetical protein
MRCALAVIAKSPLRGQVKTRLCPPLTPDQAAELYRAFLLDTLALINTVSGVEPAVLFTPTEAEADFRSFTPAHFFFVPQRGADLGERLPNGLHDFFALGYAAAVIMDSDSPTLPRAYLQELFTLLAKPTCDVVLGPCADGGYYAVGMKRTHREIFQRITWSTDVVLEETLQRARDAQLSVALAPTWYDIDQGEALARLQTELKTLPASLATHTRAVMRSLNGG